MDKAIEAMRKLLEAAIPHLEESEALRRVDEACKGFFAAQRRIDKALELISNMRDEMRQIGGPGEWDRGYLAACRSMQQILAGEKE